jgi:hypothetical protein
MAHALELGKLLVVDPLPSLLGHGGVAVGVHHHHYVFGADFDGDERKRAANLGAPLAHRALGAGNDDEHGQIIRVLLQNWHIHSLQRRRRKMAPLTFHGTIKKQCTLTQVREITPADL